MPQLVSHEDRPRMIQSPPAPVRITERKQIKAGHRGLKYQWLPSGSELRVVTSNNQTTGISPSVVAASSITHPPDATGVIVFITVNANTNTAGQARGMVLKDENSTSALNAAVIVSQEMGNNTWKSYAVGVAPFTQGGIYYMTESNGTVNYDFHLDVIGWVLE